MNTAAVNTRTATPEEDLILVLALSMGNRKLAVAVSRTEMRGVIKGSGVMQLLGADVIHVGLAISHFGDMCYCPPTRNRDSPN